MDSHMSLERSAIIELVSTAGAELHLSYGVYFNFVLGQLSTGLEICATDGAHFDTSAFMNKLHVGTHGELVLKALWALVAYNISFL